MEAFKGTKGQWLVNYSSHNKSQIVISGGQRMHVCYIEANDEDNTLTDLEWSDASLIASAPELLKMLSDFVRCYKRDGYLTNADLEDAEELIAKALGNDKKT